MINGAAFAVTTLRPTPLGRPHPATRLAGLVLALTSAMVLGPVAVALWLGLLALGLAWTGLPQLVLMRIGLRFQQLA